MQDRKKSIHASEEWLPLWIRHLFFFLFLSLSLLTSQKLATLFLKRPPWGESMRTKILVEYRTGRTEEERDLKGDGVRKEQERRGWGCSSSSESSSTDSEAYTKTVSLSVSQVLCLDSIDQHAIPFPSQSSLSTRVASLPFFVCLPRFVAIFMLHLLLSMPVSLRSLCLTESDACSLVSRSGSSFVFFCKKSSMNCRNPMMSLYKDYDWALFPSSSFFFSCFLCMTWEDRTVLRRRPFPVSFSSSLILKVIFSCVVTSDCRATRSLFFETGKQFQIFLVNDYVAWYLFLMHMLYCFLSLDWFSCCFSLWWSRYRCLCWSWRRRSREGRKMYGLVMSPPTSNVCFRIIFLFLVFLERRWWFRNKWSIVHIMLSSFCRFARHSTDAFLCISFFFFLPNSCLK